MIFFGDSSPALRSFDGRVTGFDAVETDVDRVVTRQRHSAVHDTAASQVSTAGPAARLQSPATLSNRQGPTQHAVDQPPWAVHLAR